MARSLYGGGRSGERLTPSHTRTAAGVTDDFGRARLLPSHRVPRLGRSLALPEPCPPTAYSWPRRYSTYESTRSASFLASPERESTWLTRWSRSRKTGNWRRVLFFFFFFASTSLQLVLLVFPAPRPSGQPRRFPLRRRQKNARLLSMEISPGPTVGGGKAAARESGRLCRPWDPVARQEPRPPKVVCNTCGRPRMEDKTFRSDHHIRT